jgi:hypothetical protein
MHVRLRNIMIAAIWHRIIVVAAFVVTLAGVTPAWAGELLVGAEPLEVGDDGNITKAGRSAAVTKLEALPGNSAWVLHLWAKVDNGAVGPMYVEFYRHHEGRRLTAYRDEIADYAGGKFVSHTVEIPRTRGFRAGETIELVFTQSLVGKGDVKYVKAKIELEKSSQPDPEPEPEPEPEDEPEDDLEEEASTVPEPEPAPEPPPIEPASKKGCTLAATTPHAALALLLLAAFRRRRCASLGV